MQQGTRQNQMGRMTTPSKFHFNLDFAEPEEPEVEVEPEPVVPTITVAEHEALLAKAKKQAFEEGRAKALEDLKGTQESLLTDEVRSLVQVAGNVVGELDACQARLEEESVSLAFLVARRLCAHLLSREPLAETVALVAECLGPLRNAPHIVIRVAENDVEALKERTDPIVHEKGFEGRLVILGEPELPRGDCHIEWADGGIKRDRKALEKEIDAIIRAYLKAQRAQTGVGATGVAADRETEE